MNYRVEGYLREHQSFPCINYKGWQLKHFYWPLLKYSFMVVGVLFQTTCLLNHFSFWLQNHHLNAIPKPIATCFGWDLGFCCEWPHHTTSFGTYFFFLSSSFSVHTRRRIRSPACEDGPSPALLCCPLLPIPLVSLFYLLLLSPWHVHQDLENHNGECFHRDKKEEAGQGAKMLDGMPDFGHQLGTWPWTLFSHHGGTWRLHRTWSHPNGVCAASWPHSAVLPVQL